MAEYANTIPELFKGAPAMITTLVKGLEATETNEKIKSVIAKTIDAIIACQNDPSL